LFGRSGLAPIPRLELAHEHHHLISQLSTIQQRAKEQIMGSSGLENGSVIVTGAGSGIGRAAALRFATEGARVVVADINAESATAVVQEIEAAGGTAMAVTGDLSERAVVDQVVSTAVGRFGGVDVLVNNAGIMDRMSATADVSDEEWERVIRVNLTAPFLLTRAALPHMLAKGKGAIVYTASEAALRGSAAGTPYTASKHGIVGSRSPSRSCTATPASAPTRLRLAAPGPTCPSMPFRAPTARPSWPLTCTTSAASRKRTNRPR
jgi:NAD(P)-dependent dehydrogenase (short-subunit alcohol dehydrogenase family)